MGRDWTTKSIKKWSAAKHKLYTHHNIKNRYKSMEKAYNVFRGCGLTVWLSFGALLTLYRDGKLQEYDDDIDFACREEEFGDKFETIKGELLKQEFDIITPFKNNIISYKKGEKISLVGWELKGKWRLFHGWCWPDKFFKGYDTITANGVKYPCHSPIEEYLSWVYEDWKTPQKEKGWNENAFE